MNCFVDNCREGEWQKQTACLRHFNTIKFVNLIRSSDGFVWKKRLVIGIPASPSPLHFQGHIPSEVNSLQTAHTQQAGSSVFGLAACQAESDPCGWVHKGDSVFSRMCTHLRVNTQSSTQQLMLGKGYELVKWTSPILDWEGSHGRHKRDRTGRSRWGSQRMIRWLPPCLDWNSAWHSESANGTHSLCGTVYVCVCIYKLKIEGMIGGCGWKPIRQRSPENLTDKFAWKTYNLSFPQSNQISGPGYGRPLRVWREVS